ncbi:alkylmercury lyase [Saccharopolyspora griseoalba]|uniref:Alkylmercury lyase n=1 Tax=Saccharopolyspora griseoalba TaxID=1431848 RepID=A0ABW2LUB4_9PSEU
MTSRVRLLRVPDCPLAGRARATVVQVLRELGEPVDFDEVVGDHPSPSVLVDGVDVVTGRAPAEGPSCRLELPTAEQIRAALK